MLPADPKQTIKYSSKVFTINATIKSKMVVAEKTTAVTFDVGGDFNFVAGEYVTVTLPQLKGLELREQFRDFSVTSSPTELPNLTITYRDSESEFKQCMTGASIGDEVVVNGPKGVFTLPQDVNTPVTFIAGGVGVTPFMSMIRFAISTKQPRDISLYYFNRSRESAPYLSELEGYGPAIKLISVLGPLTKEVIKFNEEIKSKMVWFIAGPPGLVKVAMMTLKTGGVEDNKIKTEEFTGYA